MEFDAPLQKECMVHGTLSFVLYLSRLVGIAPISFKSSYSGSRISVSRGCSLFGQTMVVIFTVLSITAIMSDLADPKTAFRTNNNANRIVWLSDVVIVATVVVTAAYTGVNRMQYMIDSLAKLEHVNKALNHYNKPSMPKEGKKWVMVTALLLLGCFTVFTDFGFFMYEVIKINGKLLTSSFYIFFNISCIKLELVVLQFALTAMWVLPTLRRLNASLKSLLQRMHNDTSTIVLPPSYGKPAFTKKGGEINVFNRITNKSINRVIDSIAAVDGVKSTPASLHQLGTLYCSLCEVIRQLDDSNGLILVLLFLSFLIHLIITPYHFIIGLYHSAQSDRSNAMLQVAWAAFHFSKLIMVVEPCHRTHEELDETRNLVNQMMRYTRADDFACITELKLFHRQMLMNEVVYAPMQLFTLNRSLVATIMGTITTYLVVVIDL